MQKIKAYNIVLDVAGKLVAGVTDVDFKMTPEFEESLVKDDEGTPSLDATGQVPVEFGVSGLFFITEAGDETTHQDITDLRSVCAAGTTCAYVYGGTAVGDAIVSGNAKITDLSEKSGAKGYPSFSLSLKSIGQAPTIGTVSA